MIIKLSFRSFIVQLIHNLVLNLLNSLNFWISIAGSIPGAQNNFDFWGSETFFWVCDKTWVANSLLLLILLIFSFSLFSFRYFFLSIIRRTWSFLLSFLGSPCPLTITTTTFHVSWIHTLMLRTLFRKSAMNRSAAPSNRSRRTRVRSSTEACRSRSNDTCFFTSLHPGASSRPLISSSPLLLATWTGV